MNEQKRQQKIDETREKLAKEDASKVATQYKTLEEMLQSGEQKTKESESRREAEAKAEEHVIAEFDEVSAMKYSFDVNRLARQLELSTKDVEESADKVKYLMDWAKRTANSNDILDVLFVFKDVRKKMGFSEVGKTALSKFYQYARLQDDSERVQKEMQLLKE